LPDPCNTTFASNKTQALKIIEMHTLFVSNMEFGTAESLPKINSLVEVELEKNSFGYNLQYGKHIKVANQPAKSNTKTSTDCDSLKNIMNSATSGPIVTIGDNLTDRGVSYTEHFDENAQPILQPAQGRFSSRFGNRIHPIRKTVQFHAGIDIANAQGTPILAALAGKVIDTTTGCKSGDGGCGDKGAGNLIKLRHSDGSTTRYLHLYELKVGDGDTVSKGQEIALMGTTGGSTGPHLHFEYKKGKLLNPEFHFEQNFQDSIQKKMQETGTGILQAEKAEIAPPMENQEDIEET
jgi:murein DD-endopeptidase MepM/ murein hydrolase activator NlpD